MPDKKIYLESFLLASLTGPAAILAHEALGHWLPARLLGAKDLKIGYTDVDFRSIKDWSPSRKVVIQAGGPLVTDLLVWLSLFFLRHQSPAFKLFGWGLALTAYRGLIAPIRQIMEGKDEDIIKIDETIVAEELGVSKYLISLPQSAFSLYLLVSGYHLLPEKKRMAALAGFLGLATGTIIYLKSIGPFFWPIQEGKPEIRNLGLNRKKGDL